nr:hypothetical protein K4M19_00051 [Agrobacterium fabrum]
MIIADERVFIVFPFLFIASKPNCLKLPVSTTVRLGVVHIERSVSTDYGIGLSIIVEAAGLPTAPASHYNCSFLFSSARASDIASMVAVLLLSMKRETVFRTRIGLTEAS